MRLAASLAVLLVLPPVVLVAAPRAAAAPARTAGAPCTDGQWALAGEGLLPGVGLDADLLVLAGGGLRATSTSACGTATATFVRRGGRTRLRAEWPACGVRLVAQIRGTDCAQLRGTVSVGGALRRRVVAVRVASGSVNVVPLPAGVETSSASGSFVIGRRTRLRAASDAASRAAARLHAVVAPHVPGLAPLAGGGGPLARRYEILLVVDAADAALGAEGYRLFVAPDRVTLRAAAPAGLEHGVQTLRQLLPAEVERSERVRGLDLALPVGRIVDVPRFRWRGLLFDVSRTFYDATVVRRMIDLAALFKLNVLHLHLTDDQGWRFESLTHPALHQLGSVWDPVLAPGERSGYFTQAELRELVAYAAERGIEIVPEIDMPGHVLAALHAMPELACTTAPGVVRSREEFPIVPYHLGPFIHPEILCAGREQVYAVMQDVLDELLAVFPSPFVHLGGDEVPKDEWNTSFECQDVIAREGLAGSEHLQAWFTKRMETFLRSRGRRLVGWDEILDAEAAGDARTRLADDTVVMRWRGYLPPPAGLYDRDVVFSPFPPLYFDYNWPDRLRLAYEVEPAPADLPAEQAARVLGVQGNMWTGWPSGRTEAGVDQHVFPRLPALAEVGWTPRERRDFAAFSARLAAQQPRLDLLGVAREP